MIKAKKHLILILALCIVLLSIFTCYLSMTRAYAAAEENIQQPLDEEAGNENVTPRLFTSLSISINGGDGKVWTTVRNDFTLFPSTVYVVVQLYCSDTYCEDYRQMTMVASNSTTDLNIYNTISAEASTNGQVKYWIGRMRYSINGGNWEERIAGPAKYSATGEFISLD